MKSKTKRIFTMILCFALASVLGGGALLSAFSVTATAAEIDISTSDPLDDLNGATVLGEQFDPAKYPFKENGEIQFLIMTEYGFGARSGMKDKLELYFYFYNPQSIELTDNSLNSVKMQYLENGDTVTLPLKIVSRSKGAGYERLFYKFKVDFSNSPVSREDIWEALTEENKPRTYNIASVNLYPNGVLKHIDIGNKFTFQGFMQGYGYVSSDKSSLQCTSGKSEIIPIKIGTTYYRADALNNGAEQDANPSVPLIDAVDSLHSLYVAIPNDKIKEYGRVTKFTGQYIDALTVPMLIVGDEEVYNTVKNYVGVNVGASHIEDLKYRFYSDFERFSMGGTASVNLCGYSYHYYQSMGVVSAVKKIDTLHVLFSTERFGTDAADAKFLVAGADVQEYFTQNTGNKTYQSPSGYVYGTKYFETDLTNPQYTKFEVDDKSVLDLTGDVITHSFWSKVFPGISKPEVSEFYDKDFSVLHEVTDKDFDVPGSDTEKVKKICDNLLIAERDYEDFREYYRDAIKENKTVYLLRYRISDYYAEEATIFDGGWFGQPGGLTDWIKNTNACFAQMHVDLGLELLDVTFTADSGVVTVIPLTMKPVDVFHDITGAVNTTSDKTREGFELLVKLILGVIVIVAVCAAFTFITPLKILLDMCIKGVKLLLRLVTWPIRFLFGLLFRTKK